MSTLTRFDQLPEQARPTVLSLVSKTFCTRDSGWTFDYEFELASISGHEQVRIGDQILYQPRVSELNEIRSSGVMMPPIVVDKDNYLLEGKHRVAAAEKRKDTTIQAIILDLSFAQSAPEVQLKLREFAIWANHNTGPMDFPRSDKRLIVDRILSDYAALGLKPKAEDIAAQLRFPLTIVRDRMAYQASLDRARARMEKTDGPRFTTKVNPDGTVESVTREPPIINVNPSAVAKLIQLSDERAALVEPLFVEFEERRGKKMSGDAAQAIVRDIRIADADEVPIKIAAARQLIAGPGSPGSNLLRTALTSTELGGKRMSLTAAIEYVLLLVASQDCIERNPDSYDLHIDKIGDAKNLAIKLTAAFNTIIEAQKKLIAAEAQSVIDAAVSN